MRKSNQLGAGAVDVLLWIFVAFVCVYWLVTYLPAQVEDVKEVAALAETSEQAKSEFAASLKEIPNPSRSELQEMRARIDEILVTETARAVTGDSSLDTPTTIKAIREKDQIADRAAINSKGWSDLNAEQRIQFLADRIFLVAAVLALGGLVLAVVSRMRRG